MSIDDLGYTMDKRKLRRGATMALQCAHHRSGDRPSRMCFSKERAWLYVFLIKEKP